MELHGTPWNSMDLHRIPWNSMEFYGIPWGYFTRESQKYKLLRNEEPS